MKPWLLPLLAGLLAVSAGAQVPVPAATNLWELAVPGGGGGSSPALAPDGTIYLGTFRGTLLAATPGGKVKWRFQAGREIKSSPAVGADGTIYFGARDGKFYAVTPDGKLKWTFATGAWVDTSPAIAVDGTVYFGSWDTNFYALAPDGNLKWKFAAGGIIDSSPAIGADGAIYFGSHDKFFYAVTPDGKLKWKFATGAEIIASPAIGADGTVYFASTDGNFYALGADGAQRWKLHTGGYTSSSPVVGTDGGLYLMVNQLHTALNPGGTIRWQNGNETRLDMTPAVSASGAVYFSAVWRALGAFDGGQGAQLWGGQMRDYVNSSPAVDERGDIYACDGGYLYATRPPTNAAPPAKSPWPQWRADAQHTGRAQK